MLIPLKPSLKLPVTSIPEISNIISDQLYPHPSLWEEASTDQIMSVFLLNPHPQLQDEAATDHLCNYFKWGN